MNASSRRRLLTLAAATTLVASSSMADDTEIFFGDQGSSAALPNVLMIMDTSGSMDDHVVTQPIYDPNHTYAGSCDATRVYWATNSSPPTCSTNNWINETALVCQAARTAFLSTGGFFYGRAQRWNRNTNNGNWQNLSNSNRDHIVECEEDWGVHGETTASTDRYPRNTTTTNAYRNTATGAISWNGRQRYRIYSANYLNWYHENRLSTLSKMEIVKGVSQSLVDTINGVNLGLMRFSNNDEDNNTENLRAQGGMVLHEVAPIATARQSIRDTIGTFQPQGFTPLSETLYEAARYFRGEDWVYGQNARGYNEVSQPSVPASRLTSNTNRYKSPIEYACQKNYVVYLTDGLPTADTGANTTIGTMINGTGGTCDVSAGISGNGQCLDDLAEYMFTHDQNTTIAGEQRVQTYTIGFDVDFPLLDSTATRGGGSYYTANDTGSLINALTTIVSEIADTSATFSSPAVAVNAFNRSQHENDLFVTVFRPSSTTRWSGNLKRYRLDPENQQIVDENGRPAVDTATGFFLDSAQEIWSDAVDGNNVTQGGAANRIPLPNARNVYTYHPGGTTPALSSYPFSIANDYLTAARLDLADPEDPTRDQLIQWARGATIDDDGVINTGVARHEMGDPLHSKPATVVYGPGTTGNALADTVVYVATNDGYLHAIAADTGVELWSFIPSEMWGRLHLLMQNAQTDSKSYGIDGNLSVVRDGTNWYLYFGMRRGGNFYYALNITNKNSPQFMWKATPTELPGLGQSWSTPQPTQIRIGTTSYKALVFGGGYETDQDPAANGTTSYSTDTVGNRIFIVNALTGARLWSAGPTSPAATLAVPDMQYSIPSDVRVLDLNNDRFADRMYVGDMGGQVWRFDIHSNATSAANLVTGGVIASLGNAHETSHPASSLRRFYYAPSISMIRDGVNRFITIGIGSGYREGPLNTQTDDRLYLLRDPDMFGPLTAQQFVDYDVITDATTTLIDVTDSDAEAPVDVPVGSRGWKWRLTADGEKTVAEARTINFQVYFTSYTPNTGVPSENPCLPRAGTNTLYMLDLLTGRLIQRTQSVGDMASEVIVMFPGAPDDPDGPEDPPDDPEPCDPADPECEVPPPPQCLPGQPCGAACIWELGACPGNLANPAIRTFWRQQDIDTH